MTLPIRKFGVEIEFIGLYPEDAARAISQAGYSCHHEGYNHATRNHWKIVPDSSLQVTNRMQPGQSGELVSPPLVGEEGIRELRAVVAALKAAGGTVNASCGLHVHVDANDLNAGQIISVVRRYAHFEQQINAFMPPSRRNSRFAFSVGGSYVDDILTAVNRNGNHRNVFGTLNRYMAVNLASYARHGTIEFRQHSGTTNPDKIENWVKFCLFFVSKAITATVLPVSTEQTPAAVASTSPARRRGRRPNYAARRELWNYLLANSNLSIYREDLARACGISASRLTPRGQIMSEISQFARVSFLSRQRLRFEYVTNEAMADVWLGRVESDDPALDARQALQNHRNRVASRRATVYYTVPMVNDTESLFDQMPPEVINYYQRRASAFA